MPRPPKPRRVSFIPSVTYFKPQGVPLAHLAEIRLGIDELEALRLKDIVGLDQEEAAGQMGLTQSTFQRVLTSARRKVSLAIVGGKALRIEGGPYQAVQRWLCGSCGRTWEGPFLEEKEMVCPECDGTQVRNLPPESDWKSAPWKGSGRGRKRCRRG